MFAARLDGKYVFAHLGEPIDIIDGGTPSTDFSLSDVYETGGPSPHPSAIVYSGGDPGQELQTRTIGLIDLTGEQPFYVDIIGDINTTPSSLYFQPTEGKLYILSGLQVAQEFDDDSKPLLAMVWKSRRFQMASVETFGAIWVETEEEPSSSNVLTTRVFVDGTLVAQITGFNSPQRIPSVLGQRWEIEIEGTATISAVQMATTIEEMGQ
jgi:acyl transferase domain-containing protein